MPAAHDPDSLLRSLRETAASGPDVSRRLEDAGMSDGLPMAAPTSDAVDAAVRALGGEPHRVVATVPPLRSPLTVEGLATVLILAGADDSHAPTLEAVAVALQHPELNAPGVLTTTGSAAFVVVVSGPAREAVGFNSGANCLGPGNRSNAVVGRSLSLITRIVGGAREGMMDMATMGQPAKYSFCFAENEKASPWAPLHVDAGLAADASAVTVMGVAGTIEAFDAAALTPTEMVASLAPILAVASPDVRPDLGYVGGGHQMVVISPEWAEAFAIAGMSKPDVRQMLFDEAGSISGRDVAATPEQLLLVIAGGPGVKQTLVPGWNGGSAPVMVPLPPGSSE